jgi:8-oxo-dGTP pyrophosphatase MutT (NUDIX family)
LSTVPDYFYYQLDEDSPLDWEEEYRKNESSYGIFDVYRATRVSPRGQRANFVVVDAPDWVTVVPVIKDESGVDCFPMVRQYRQGSQTTTMEFPAGVVKWEKEPRDAARRELVEETGRTPEEVIYLGESNPNPTFMCNITCTFLAMGLGPEESQELDEFEEIERVLVPIDDVALKMGTPPYDSTIVMSALAYYLRWKSEVSADQPEE